MASTTSSNNEVFHEFVQDFEEVKRLYNKKAFRTSFRKLLDTVDTIKLGIENIVILGLGLCSYFKRRYPDKWFSRKRVSLWQPVFILDVAKHIRDERFLRTKGVQVIPFPDNFGNDAEYFSFDELQPAQEYITPKTLVYDPYCFADAASHILAHTNLALVIGTNMEGFLLSTFYNLFEKKRSRPWITWYHYRIHKACEFQINHKHIMLMYCSGWDDKALTNIVSENRICLYVSNEDAGHLNWPSGRGVLVQRLEVDNVLEAAEKGVEVHGNCELCATLVREYIERFWSIGIGWKELSGRCRDRRKRLLEREISGQKERGC